MDLKLLGTANKCQISTFAMIEESSVPVSVIFDVHVHLYEEYLIMFCFKSSTP